MAIVLISLALIVCLGLLACLKGQKLVSLFLTIYAFFVTFQFVSEQVVQDSTGIIIALASAVAVALLAQYAQKTAFFILGFLIGSVLGKIAVPYFPTVTGMMVYALIGGCAIVMGLIFAHWHKVMIRIGTSYIGGEMISRCVVFLVTQYQVLDQFSKTGVVETFLSLIKLLSKGVMDTMPLWVLAMTAGITIVGTIYQNHHR